MLRRHARAAVLASLLTVACAPGSPDDGSADAGSDHTTGPYTGATTAQWTEVGQGLGGHMHCFASAGSVVYAGSGSKVATGYPGGVVVISRDEGATWTPTTLQTSVSDLEVAGTTVYATTIMQGLMKSTDEGATWTAVPVPNTGTTIFNTIGIHGTRIFLGIGPTVHYSDDSGATWTKVLTSLPGSAAITQFLFDGDRVVATARGGLIVSTDRGATWTEREDGLPYHLLADGAARIADALFVVTHEGLYRATVASGAFEEVSDEGRGMVHAVQTALFVSPGNGRGGRVQLSLDNGATWTPFHDGLPEAVAPVAFHTVGRYLLSSTAGSIWRTALY